MEGDIDRLRTRLSAFDGRAMTVLGEIAADFGGADDYPDLLITLAGDASGPVSSGATWLIKSRLEKGARLTDVQTAALCARMDSIEDWSAQLHVCQSVQYLEIGSGEAAGLVRWLKPLLTHKRPFLRAWALDALCHVARRHSGFVCLARDALSNGHDDPAASVRARARNIQL